MPVPYRFQRRPEDVGCEGADQPTGLRQRYEFGWGDGAELLMAPTYESLEACHFAGAENELRLKLDGQFAIC